MTHSNKKQDIKKNWDELGFLEGLKGLDKAEGKKRNTRLRNQINKSETTKIFEAYPIGFLHVPIEGEVIEDPIYYISRISRLLYDMPSTNKYNDIIDKEDLTDIRMVVLEWFVEMLHKNKGLQ